MSARNVAKAMRAARRGEAHHWPTVAAILADEVERLRGERIPTGVETLDPETVARIWAGGAWEHRHKTVRTGDITRARHWIQAVNAALVARSREVTR